VTAAWRLGPRLGRFTPSPGADAPAPSNVALIGIGVLVVVANLVIFAVVGGYQVIGTGYFGIAFSSSGIGLVAVNLFCAMFGGSLGGIILSFKLRSPLWAIAGPFIGYVSVTTFNDIGSGWYLFFVGFAAVYAGYGTSLLLQRLRIDEDKLGPLVLGPGIFGCLAGGFLTWGTKTGGIPGIEEGTYAFQSAEVAPWWQLLGLVVAVGGAFLFVTAVCLVLERTTGLRVTREQEIAGLDATYWSGVPSKTAATTPVAAASEHQTMPPAPVLE
jgi:ammonia channel protein AmtB